MVEKKSENQTWKFHQGIYKHLFPNVYGVRGQEEKEKQESHNTKNKDRSSDSNKEREKIIEEWQSFATGS